MPLNPSIPLGATMAPVASPLEIVQALQQNRRQNDAADALAEERRAQTALHQATLADVAQRQQDRADLQTQNQTLDQLMQGALTPDPVTGVAMFDTGKITQGLVDAGQGHRVGALMPVLDALHQSSAAQAAEARKSIALALRGVQLAGNSPEAAQAGLAYLVKNRALDATAAQPVLEAIQGDPSAEGIDRLLTGFGAKLPEYQDLLKTETAQRTAAAQAAATLTKTQADARKATAEATNLETNGRTTPPEPGSFGDYVQRYANEQRMPVRAITTTQLEALRKAYQQADDRPRITVNTGNPDDVKEAVSAMAEGTVPPQLPGRASKEYLAVMAEARRQGYDLASAATDWSATQKYVGTLNGSQQIRLRQGIDTATHSLDMIDDLAKQWDGGRFPILNRASLVAAMNGAQGPQAAQIATALNAQINDLSAELGNVYMGGNSPTDHALKLAQSNLSSDWSKDTLLAMTKLARQNLQVRDNSMKNVGVAGASDNNPYWPRQPQTGGDTGGSGQTAPLRQPIPGHPGAFAESTDGGKTWKRVQ